MLLYNDLERINNVDIKDFYILTDFDGTITKDKSDSSWASIFKNPKVTNNFVNKCIEIYNYYHKYEIDETISDDKKMKLMNEWYRVNVETLIKFKITEEIINYSANNETYMQFRDGAKDFLKDMYDKNVPIIVISAGVGNIIEQFLIKNKCNYSNIYICSNFLEYTNKIVSGVKNKNLIHALNKNEISLPKNIQDKIANKNNTIILGNNISDIKMATSNKNVFKIGFLNENVNERIATFKENFDIVCTNNENYNELRKIIKVFK